MITTEVRKALDLLAKMDPERAKSAESVLLSIEKSLGEDPLAWWGAVVANGMWSAWFELVDNKDKGKLPAIDVPMILDIFFDTHPQAKVAELKYHHLRQGIPTPEQGREIVKEEMALSKTMAANPMDAIKNMSEKELTKFLDRLTEKMTEIQKPPPKKRPGNRFTADTA